MLRVLLFLLLVLLRQDLLGSIILQQKKEIKKKYNSFLPTVDNQTSKDFTLYNMTEP